jgi:hypothetical protein
MKHGFRVYSFQVLKRSRGKIQDLGGGFGTQYLDRLEVVLKGLVDQGLTGRPDYNTILAELPDPAIGTPLLRVIDVERMATHVSCEVSYGVSGEHEDLLSDDASSIESILDKAASRRYRFEFYFPVGGTEGILVAEVIANKVPIELLMRWITREHARLVEDEPREEWNRISYAQLGDASHLRELIRNAKKTKVMFTAQAVTSRGRPGQKTRELSLYQTTDSQAKALADEMLRWLKGTHQGAVEKVQRAVGLNPNALAKANMTFNFTAIRVEGDDPTTITPTSITEVFTYPISHDIRPSDATWKDATIAKASVLSAGEGIEIVFD